MSTHETLLCERLEPVGPSYANAVGSAWPKPKPHEQRHRSIGRGGPAHSPFSDLSVLRSFGELSSADEVVPTKISPRVTHFVDDVIKRALI